MAYDVTANVYSEECNDYIEHWHGGTFDTFEEAEEFWEMWLPPADEVQAAVDNDWTEDMSDHYELEVGVWDHDTGEGVDECFWNEGLYVTKG